MLSVRSIEKTEGFRTIIGGNIDFVTLITEETEGFLLCSQGSANPGVPTAPRLKTSNNNTYPCRAGIFPATVQDGSTTTSKGVIVESSYPNNTLYRGLFAVFGSETLSMAVPRDRPDGTRNLRYTDLTPFRYALIRATFVRLSAARNSTVRSTSYVIVPYTGTLVLPAYGPICSDPGAPFNVDIDDNQGGKTRIYQVDVPGDGTGFLLRLNLNQYQAPNDSRANVVRFIPVQQGQIVGTSNGSAVVADNNFGPGPTNNYLCLSVQNWDFGPKVAYDYAAEQLIHRQNGNPGEIQPSGGFYSSSVNLLSGYFQGTFSFASS